MASRIDKVTYLEHYVISHDALHHDFSLLAQIIDRSKESDQKTVLVYQISFQVWHI